MTLLWDKDHELSATGMGSLFSLNAASIGLITISKSSKFEKVITGLIIFCFLLSIVCIIRIGSRTQLGVALIGLVIPFLMNFRSRSVTRSVVLISLSAILTLYVLSNFDIGADWFHFFADRAESEEYGIGTAGGRTAEWISGIEKIIEHPFGWKEAKIDYAHNLWLDIARVGSVLAFFVILYLTIIIIPLFLRVFRYLKTKNHFLRTYLSLFFLCFYLQFFLEPIVEGMLRLFLIFFLFVGVLAGFDELRKMEKKSILVK